MPSRFMPLVSDNITTAPSSEPITLPTPPAAETPPTYAAAIASISNSDPAVMVADFNRAVNRMPDSADRKPIEPNTIRVIF